ncbi:hypothetical protein HYS91_03480 [Candidatus Daviesbacteria bacterium]|nr:hypothetical protein [Candidatus Daviesbacteria bacterium]
MKGFPSKKTNLIFFLCLFLFLLLTFKNPFSKRTLIPNFEPYPDTFHYINPALSFVKGEGFKMGREGREIKVNVPPMYSLSLIPAFLIKPDPRMAYYANLFLAFISLFLFWAILKKLFINKLILYSLLILYISNYFIYFVPSIILAENLTLTLYLTVLFFFISKTTVLNSVLTIACAVGLYATKYANIPLTTTVILLSFAKAFFIKITLKQKIKLALIISATFILAYLTLQIYEQNTKGRSTIGQFYEHISSIYKSSSYSALEAKKANIPKWFGTQYVNINLPMYFRSLLGLPNRFLWDNTPLVPNFIAIGGIIGILMNIFVRKFRFISFILLSLISSTVIFMSTFYSFDARYIYIAIPSLLIGFGLFLSTLENRIFTQRRKLLHILIVIFMGIYLLTSFIRIKSQISLNLRYAETPWNYIAVLKMNEFFTMNKIIDGKKPVLISALPPFLIDYYSNGNYTLLPLSYEQEFRDIKEVVWGPNDYSDLSKLYSKYLKEGFKVYVSRAGLGNESYTNRDFNDIVSKFKTEIVIKGCYDQCNIYSVALRE